MFVDQVLIHVRGGKGGSGCVSFLREKYMPKGGPDGGDGGHGGSVYLLAKDGVDTLLSLAGRHHWHAENGEAGSSRNCIGKNGRHLVVTVPTGTLVYDSDTGALLKDMLDDGMRIRVARGGRGGYGNRHFATSTNQAPREFRPGQPGRERNLRLELKLIADVGFVGLPNAGKSTLLSRLSRARPKIAAYPFTTLEPNLGVLELSDYRRLVLADIPGLIEGAHAGHGLGHEFLRHVERTRVIVHLIDICPPEGTPLPAEAYHVIRGELAQYSPELATRREIIVANKCDLTGADENLAALRDELGVEIHAISGVTGRGLRELAVVLWRTVDEVKREQAAEAARVAAAAVIDVTRVTAGPNTGGRRSPFVVAPAGSEISDVMPVSDAASRDDVGAVIPARTVSDAAAASVSGDASVDDVDVDDLGDVDAREAFDPGGESDDERGE